MTAAFHLAQVNIGLTRAPLDSAKLAGFVAALEPINALTDASPGFVWRLQTEDGDATAVRGFGDDRLIINMSVWESIEALATFVYDGAYVAVMRQRRQWFQLMREAFMVLWWVPVGHLPTVAEAEDRLAHLCANGPSPDAFTFKSPFPSGARGAVPAVLRIPDLCGQRE
ncbi:MAG: DUF3291 domain-containing protein [Egibacteraceae bacterium]